MYLLFESSQELSTANDRLQSEIKHRQAIQFALDEMNRTLEATVSERTKQLQEALDQLKSAQHKVIQQEQLSAIGRLSSGIAHELNNTLLPVVAYSELSCNQQTIDPEQREWLSSINQSASDAIGIIRELQQFHQPSEDSRFEPVDLHSILEQVYARTRPRWKGESELCDRRIEFEMALDEVSMVRGNEIELRQMFTCGFRLVRS
jgi:C4-dicarboxylate-specific signal transduction histidine kinase